MNSFDMLTICVCSDLLWSDLPEVRTVFRRKLFHSDKLVEIVSLYSINQFLC